MNEQAVERLIEASEALLAAIDASDIDAIETALQPFGESVAALKSPGGQPWSPGLHPHLAQRVAHALELATTARTKVRYLADRNQQRLDMLAAAAGRFDPLPITYGRQP